MLRSNKRNPTDHHPVSDTDLLDRINEALIAKGLRLQAKRRRTMRGATPQFEFVQGERHFDLRVGIDELARALGILSESDQADPHVHARSRPCVCELR